MGGLVNGWLCARVTFPRLFYILPRLTLIDCILQEEWGCFLADRLGHTPSCTVLHVDSSRTSQAWFLCVRCGPRWILGTF